MALLRQKERSNRLQDGIFSNVSFCSPNSSAIRTKPGISFSTPDQEMRLASKEKPSPPENIRCNCREWLKKHKTFWEVKPFRHLQRPETKSHFKMIGHNVPSPTLIQFTRKWNRLSSGSRAELVAQSPVSSSDSSLVAGNFMHVASLAIRPIIIARRIDGLVRSNWVWDTPNRSSISLFENFD